MQKKETKQEKKERLAKHEQYMQFVLGRFFKKKNSDVFKTDYYVCKRCALTFYDEKSATGHYFNQHKNG